MLIRSSSTPILKSWVASHSVELSPEPDFFHHIPKTKSISLTTTSFSSSPHSGNSPNKITRARSENDLRDLVVQKRNSFNQSLNKFIEDEEQDPKKNSKFLSIDGLFSSSGLDELVEEVEYKMIESNPGNGLLLGNYAKFLKEVRGDLIKAEEYCERAILVNPDDANVLELCWNWGF
ncbi:Tetratricopeptide repeat (TPR)-like superfamily protein [Thalictrum thalictroides]|uniref:Tetratricopeptide repeat (TPR)-like superfamily protein n=1 Tax=Thalictrum thalictroides TaxID=46969 RepID=A0A7J6UWE5_THATH|nr:Tetratricopeptide repeat (TPR)-like superfamily protein [Thalictrum thalictroides]